MSNRWHVRYGTPSADPNDETVWTDFGVTDDGISLCDDVDDEVELTVSANFDNWPEPSENTVAAVRARLEARIAARQPKDAEATLDAVDEALQAHYSHRSYFDKDAQPDGADWPFNSF